jgi:hypothetical protein
MKTFEEWSFFKKNNKTKELGLAAIKDVEKHRDEAAERWHEFRTKIDLEAELAGYATPQEYMEFLVKSGKLTNKQRVYYMVG